MLIDIEQSWPVDDELVVYVYTGSSVGEPSRWLLSYLHVVVTRSTLCNISLSHQTHEHETKAHWGEQSQLCQFTPLGGFRESGRWLSLVLHFLVHLSTSKWKSSKKTNILRSG